MTLGVALTATAAQASCCKAPPHMCSDHAMLTLAVHVLCGMPPFEPWVLTAAPARAVDVRSPSAPAPRAAKLTPSGAGPSQWGNHKSMAQLPPQTWSCVVTGNINRPKARQGAQPPRRLQNLCWVRQIERARARVIGRARAAPPARPAPPPSTGRGGAWPRGGRRAARHSGAFLFHSQLWQRRSYWFAGPRSICAGARRGCSPEARRPPGRARPRAGAPAAARTPRRTGGGYAHQDHWVPIHLEATAAPMVFTCGRARTRSVRRPALPALAAHRGAACCSFNRAKPRPSGTKSAAVGAQPSNPPSP